MSETETSGVDPSVVGAFENLSNIIKQAGVAAEFGSPEFALLVKTNKEVKKAMTAYTAGPKARKPGGQRGRPKKNTTEVAEAAE